ncbi:hypothetical protein ALC57_06310 [Trachymyrmex cornetzi]|uniref:Uncharacterized protein n=1 Tax=Trachymyrmex cornetzi TaxID=471704 RepID=A0A195E980_9HYME|nr:hypothetical protein ALC57_06310 [Trachymyrmex cornetzi]
MQCSSMCALCSQRIAADRPKSISDVVRRASEQASKQASKRARQAGRQACPMVTAITAHASRLPRPRREHKQTSYTPNKALDHRPFIVSAKRRASHGSAWLSFGVCTDIERMSDR